MNPTKICWCDRTWNPIVGCSRGCSYCYARRITERFYDRYERMILDGRAIPAQDLTVPCHWTFSNPLFIPERLSRPAAAKKSQWVFVSSMGELFDPKVPDEWRDEILKAMLDAPQHVYILLTKRPDDAASWLYPRKQVLPRKLIVGMSVSREHAWLSSHLEQLTDLQWPMVPPRICVSAEPLHGELPTVLSYLTHIHWLIIGAQTGPGAVTPKPEWITELVQASHAAGVPVWVKHNARAYCEPGVFVQEKPEV